jgi:hypothetical protein
MKEVLSSMSAGKIWRESMDTAIDFLQLPAEEFQRPSGLVDAYICSGGPNCRPELFPSESVPRGARIVQTSGQPVPTVVATQEAPAQQPAGPQPAAKPQAPEAEATAEPAPNVLFPVAPIVAPQRTPGPPPQATPPAPAPKPQAPAQQQVPPPGPPQVTAPQAPGNRFQPPAQQQPAQPLVPSNPATKPQTQPATKPQTQPASKPQTQPATKPQAAPTSTQRR